MTMPSSAPGATQILADPDAVSRMTNSPAPTTEVLPLGTPPAPGAGESIPVLGPDEFVGIDFQYQGRRYRMAVHVVKPDYVHIERRLGQIVRGMVDGTIGR